jgi:hypothetical protein
MKMPDWDKSFDKAASKHHAFGFIAATANVVVICHGGSAVPISVIPVLVP